jgi:hypothetical protein
MPKGEFYEIFRDIKDCVKEYHNIVSNLSDLQARVRNKFEELKNTGSGTENSISFAENIRKEYLSEESLLDTLEKSLSTKIDDMIRKAVSKKLHNIVGKPPVCLDEEDKKRWLDIQMDQKGSWDDVDSEEYDEDLVAETIEFTAHILKKYKDSYEEKEVEYMKKTFGIDDRWNKIKQENQEIKEHLENLSDVERVEKHGSLKGRSKNLSDVERVGRYKSLKDRLEMLRSEFEERGSLYYDFDRPIEELYKWGRNIFLSDPGYKYNQNIDKIKTLIEQFDDSLKRTLSFGRDPDDIDFEKYLSNEMLKQLEERKNVKRSKFDQSLEELTEIVEGLEDELSEENKNKVTPKM